VAGRVVNVEHLGADSHASCLVAVGDSEERLVARTPAGYAPGIDERVALHVSPGTVHWFSPASGERISTGG